MGALKVFDGTAWQVVPVTAPLDLVSKLRKPYIASHRGGGLRFGEHTMSGYRTSMQGGFIVEQDVQPNADGEIVCMHDDTVDRTTDSTGTVLSKTSAQWRNILVDAPVAGGVREAPAFWSDVVNEFGGRCVLMPEIKGPNWTLAQRTAFFDDILARNLHRSVVVQCFTYSVVLEAIAKGIRGLMLGNTQTPAQLAADKVWGVGLPNTTTAAEIASYKAQGIVVLIYTIDTRTETTTWITTNGADGIFSNDAWWTSRTDISVSASTASDTFDWSGGVPYPGMRGNPNLAAGGADPRGEFLSGGWSQGIRNLDLLAGGAPGAMGGLVLTYPGPRGPNVLCRTRALYLENATTQTRWGAIFWGAIDPEVGYSDINTQTVSGYHLLFRRNGELVLFRKDSAQAPVQLVTTSTFALAPTTAGPEILATTKAEVALELEVNATSVIGRLMWGGVEVRQVAVNDTVNRPTNGYFQLDSNGQIVEFRDIQVRSL